MRKFPLRHYPWQNGDIQMCMGCCLVERKVNQINANERFDGTTEQVFNFGGFLASLFNCRIKVKIVLNVNLFAQLKIAGHRPLLRNDARRRADHQQAEIDAKRS